MECDAGFWIEAIGAVYFYKVDSELPSLDLGLGFTYCFFKWGWTGGEEGAFYIRVAIGMVSSP